MNILSLFDGISCGQIAINRIGINDYNYYASEIDDYAINVTQHNFAKTIQLGGVENVVAKDLPQIDLLIGGSPCQGFSFAGDQLNFNDDRSKLFFEYVRLLEQCNPTFFLFENVKMKKEYEDVISRFLKVSPLIINSSLVSAQNRKRLYWTNISMSNLPDNKSIFLKNIINNEPFIEGGALSKNIDSKTDLMCVGGIPRRSTDVSRIFGQGERIYHIDGKGPTLSASSGGKAGPANFFITDRSDCSRYRKLTTVECERLQTIPDNYTSAAPKSQRHKMIGNGWTVDVITHIFKGLL